MYNTSLKQNFLKDNIIYNTNLSAYFHAVFNHSEPWEKNFKKDLCEFTVTQIMAFYKSYLSRSLETLDNLNCQLIRYTDYCIAKEFKRDMQNCYRELTAELLIECTNKVLVDQKFITRDCLLDDLKNLQNPCEQFVPLAIYEGICGEGYSDVVSMTISQFDNSSEQIVVTLEDGRKLQVSNQLYKYASESSETYEYIAPTGKTCQFMDSDNRVIKRMCNSSTTSSVSERRRVMNLLTRVKSLTNNQVYSYVALRESGRAKMILDLMNTYGYDSVEECIRKEIDTHEYRYGKIGSIPRWLLKYEKYLED